MVSIMLNYDYIPTYEEYCKLNFQDKDFLLSRTLKDIEDAERFYMPEERLPKDIHEKLIKLREKRDSLQKYEADLIEEAWLYDP